MKQKNGVPATTATTAALSEEIAVKKAGDAKNAAAVAAADDTAGSPRSVPTESPESASQPSVVENGLQTSPGGGVCKCPSGSVTALLRERC